MSEPDTPRGPGGRPSLLTDNRQQRIVDAVRAGNYLKVAAQYAGVAESTLLSWLARGRAAAAVRDAGGEVPEHERTYVEFLEQVTRAETSAEVAAVVAWRSAFTEDWRAARDYLVRRRPERWAATTRIQMSTEEAERRIDDAVAEALIALGVEHDGPDLDLDLDRDLDDDLVEVSDPLADLHLGPDDQE